MRRRESKKINKPKKVNEVSKREQENSLKRKLLQEKFSNQREHDAVSLLNDLIIDNNEILKKNNDNKNQPHRTKIINEIPTVPPLTLDNKSFNLEVSIKPSLMASTIIEIQKFNKQKQEKLFDSLNQKADILTNEIQKPKKTIKPFTNYVKLQDPKKLRKI